MAEVMAMGHDKRGNTVYRRNEEGEELWVPGEDQQPADLFEHTSTGTITKRPLPRHCEIDDDTTTVADEFLTWKKGAVLGW